MYIAKLDPHGVYLGLDEVSEVFDGDIELEADCGLKAGKYRWNGSSFIPMPKSQQKAAPDVPSYEEALLALIQAMPTPPVECVKWAEWYKTTIGGAK